MNRGLPSFSRLSIAEACALSWALEHAPIATAPAGRGTAVHAFCCALADGATREHALSLVPAEHREWCEAVDVRALPIQREALAEWAYAWNYVTRQGRELGRVDRDYVVTADEFPGTAGDLVLVGRGHVEVSDYKTGADAPPARENLQLHAAALAVARTHGATSATVRLVYLRPDGSTWKDEHELQAFDLEVIEARLVAIAEGVRKAQAEGGDAKMGDHCTYCPALPHCPGHLALARIVPGEVPSMVTAEVVAEAWERAHAIERFAKRVKQACGAYATQFLVPLPGGKVLGPVTSTARSIDADLARPILGDLFGVEVADGAIKQSMTQASIRRALAAHRPDLDAAPAMREALAELAQADAVRVTTRTSIKAHKRGAHVEDEEEG